MTRIRNSSLTLSPPVWPVARSTDAPIVYPSHCHYPLLDIWRTVGRIATCDAWRMKRKQQRKKKFEARNGGKRDSSAKHSLELRQTDEWDTLLFYPIHLSVNYSMVSGCRRCRSAMKLCRSAVKHGLAMDRRIL